jgi:phosphatidylglycerol:prolipoprotein diacylglycerol transferase
MTVQPMAGQAEIGQTYLPRPFGKAGPDRIAGAASSALDRLGERVVLFRYRDWVFVSFGLFASVGTWLTMSLMGFLLIGHGVAPGQFLLLALTSCVAIVAGSWLLAQILDLRIPAADRAATRCRPVFVSWGGIFSLLLVIVLFGVFSGHGALVMLDAVARSTFLGHAIGRLGCLSYGCCFGRPTRSPLAITYRAPEAKAVRVGHRHGVPLHPAPLYEALLDIALLVAVNAVAFAGAPLGVPAALACVGYGCGRFAIEFLRENEGRVPVGRISLNQLIALAMALVGAALAGAVLLGEPGAAPLFAFAAPLRDAPWLFAAFLPGALMVFVGFSLHRGEVGRW